MAGFSEIFIRRRIGTALMAIGLLLVGAIAYRMLPIAPLPGIDFATIEVQAFFPGASAQTMATTVAAPLERNFANITGLSTMNSSSALGVTTITLQFDLGRKIDVAAQDVQTAINTSAGLLPRDLPNPPVYHKINPAEFTILTIALTSDTLRLTDLDQIAENIVIEQLAAIPGVGLVDYHGQTRPALRVQLDPDQIARVGLTLEDVRAAIANTTVNSPKGTLSTPHRSVVLDATDQLVSASAYANLILAWRNGGPIHLSDVGRVIEAPENNISAAWLQGKRAVLIDVHRQPGANVVDIVSRIRDDLPNIEAKVPPLATLTVVGDRTQTIETSINDVQITLVLTFLLVVAVVYVFLRSGIATLIPSVSIPLALISTFAGMALFGFTLDNLSLIGLTIAVGFVVDDAIVVTENIMRHLEMGESPVDAALAGTREVTFTVISMTLSLVAVFLPILLMGGIIGRLFREFALVVSMAVIASGVISLTVTPMLCAWLLRPGVDGRPRGMHRWLEPALQGMQRAYEPALDYVLARPRVTLSVAVAIFTATLGLYVLIPKGFIPQEDSGLIDGFIQTQTDVSYEDMVHDVERVSEIINADPDIVRSYAYIGQVPTLSRGHLFIYLKNLGSRRASATEVVGRLQRRFAGLVGVSVSLQIRQDIAFGSLSTAAQYQYSLRDADVTELTRWSEIMQNQLVSLPMLRDVTSDAQPGTSTSTLVIDRSAASRFGIRVQAIDDTLYDAFGQRQVATLFTEQNQYHVIEELAPDRSLSQSVLERLFVRSDSTQSLVPLSMLGTIRKDISPILVSHTGLSPSTTLSFNVAPGYALGAAVAAIRQAESRAGMPDSIVASFQGAAQAFESSLSTEPLLIAAALLTIYIVLGVLYDSAIHPLTILSTLPSAGFGALLMLLLTGHDLSIIGIVAILLLVGIVKKNAIMMIDFALEAERVELLPPRDAIRKACLLRFRPIMMTTFAAMLGAVPLALASGEGAEFRVPLGMAIVGGLFISQAVTLLTTPVIYLWFDRWVGVRKRRRSVAPASFVMED